MCIDYTDLNKACPKDSYPLPSIDTLVDGASGYKMLSFLDTYSGYNQIPIYAPDREKTAFMTDKANFYYEVMSFGLKNVGATYQRLMDRVFAEQIGRCMDVYVDDMVVRSPTEDDHLRDLEEVFNQIQRYGMRLNPAKCTFGVAGGKYLGFMLTSRDIEANPDKCEVVLHMSNPSTLKDVQRLVGCLTTLSRFICRTDSQLVVGQMNGEFQVKEDHLLRYFHKASALVTDFEKIEIRHIPPGAKCLRKYVIKA